MKFFDRKNELELLRRIREESKSSARMTILKGRRRIGKTSLLMEAYGDEDFLYFFVARKNEADLCVDFSEEISRYLGLTLPGGATSFEAIFRFILEVAQTRPLTLVIDEFQDFLRINASVFSAMQRDWDRLKGKAHINLVVSGSINRMMEQIFASSPFTDAPQTKSTCCLSLREASRRFSPSILRNGRLIRCLPCGHSQVA